MNPLNPLSPFTYYRRHKGQALLLLVLITSLTLSIFVSVGVMSTFSESSYHRYNHLTRVSHVLAGSILDSGTLAQLRAHPDAGLSHKKSTHYG